MLANRGCWRLYLSTSTQPSLSASGLSRMKSGALIGGGAGGRANFLTTFSFVLSWGKMAFPVCPPPSIWLWRKQGCIPRARTALSPVIASHGVLQAFDVLPVHLNAWTNHQVVIAQRWTASRADAVFIRLEGNHGIADPRHTARDKIGFAFLGYFLLCNSTANQGPEWLVVMLFRRVDDDNVELRRFSAEPGGDVDAGGAAADNQYGIVRFIHSFFNGAGTLRGFLQA